MSETGKHPSKCGNCRFWEPSGMTGPESDEEVGCCRRHAPSLVMIGAMQTTRWPTTVLSDWCGDWDHMDNPGPGSTQDE